MPIETELPIGASRRIAVLEIPKRPGWWRVWVEGKRSDGADPSARARRASGSRSPPPRRGTAVSRCATGSRSGSTVSVSRRRTVARGEPFVPGFKFQDSGFGLRSLTPAKRRRASGRWRGPRPRRTRSKRRRCSASGLAATTPATRRCGSESRRGSDRGGSSRCRSRGGRSRARRPGRAGVATRCRGDRRHRRRATPRGSSTRSSRTRRCRGTVCRIGLKRTVT